MYPPQGGYGAGRGRGGAGGRGGRGGGGGGRGRGSSLKTDYTSVRPIDYALVNKERYKTMTVDDGGQTPQRGAASGRGTSRGGPSTPYRSTPPSSRPGTPGNQQKDGQSSSHVLGWNDPSSPKSRGGRGRGGSSATARGGGLGFSNGFGARSGPTGPILNAQQWGAGSTQAIKPQLLVPGAATSDGRRKILNFGAPVFVKGGTLFQDDKHQPDNIVDSDADVPKTSSKPIQDDTEVDMDRVDSSLVVEQETVALLETEKTPQEPLNNVVSLSQTLERVELDSVAPAVVTTTEINVESKAQIALEPTEENVEFFIDTEPTVASDASVPILFEATTSTAIGQDPYTSSSEEEDEVVLLPKRKLAKEPEPITVPAEPDYVLDKSGSVKESLVQRFGGQPLQSVQDTTDEAETTKPITKKKNKKKAKREKRKRQRDERMKKTEGIVRHKMPRQDSDVEWGSDGPPQFDTLDQIETDEDDDAIQSQVKTPKTGGLSTQGLSGQKKRDMELLIDYMENTAQDQAEEVEQDTTARDLETDNRQQPSDLEALQSFVQGMSQEGRDQVTINDIHDTRKLDQEDQDDEDGWAETSGSELTDEEVQQQRDAQAQQSWREQAVVWDAPLPAFNKKQSGKKNKQKVKKAKTVAMDVDSDDGVDQFDIDDADVPGRDVAETSQPAKSLPATDPYDSDDGMDQFDIDDEDGDLDVVAGKIELKNAPKPDYDSDDDDGGMDQFDIDDDVDADEARQPLRTSLKPSKKTEIARDDDEDGLDQHVIDGDDDDEEADGMDQFDIDEDDAPAKPTQLLADMAKGKQREETLVVDVAIESKIEDGRDDEFDLDEDSDEESEEEAMELAGMGWAFPASSGDDDDDDDDDEDEDSEDDDDGTETSLDRIFGGKNKQTWADAADDFIEAMDMMVDDSDLVMGSGKKFEKNKLFNAIQNGDFGDNWATQPAPKGKKNKLKGVPKELQAQWEKDRQKKADKKRQRELDRLEAQMSLYPAMRKQGKGKASKRKDIFPIDFTAGVSARDMADMLSIDSDDSEGWGVDRSAKKRRPVTDIWSLNREIEAFLRDLGKTTMSLPPMDKASRKKVHDMAECYSLKSLSKGKGKSRFPILTKTSRSSADAMSWKHQRKLERILDGSKSQGEFYKNKFGGGGGGWGGGGGKGTNVWQGGSAARSGAGGSAVKHRDGDAVGFGAMAIGEDNIGHRLLSKMGWTEGNRIGRSEGGLEVPIVAIVKNTKLGLGA